jgi:hypothetical protein
LQSMVDGGAIAKPESAILQKLEFVTFEVFEDEPNSKPHAPIVPLNLGHPIAPLGHETGPRIGPLRRCHHPGDRGQRDSGGGKSSRERCIERSQGFRPDLAKINRLGEPG